VRAMPSCAGVSHDAPLDSEIPDAHCPTGWRCARSRLISIVRSGMPYRGLPRALGLRRAPAGAYEEWLENPVAMMPSCGRLPGTATVGQVRSFINHRENAEQGGCAATRRYQCGAALARRGLAHRLILRSLRVLKDQAWRKRRWAWTR